VNQWRRVQSPYDTLLWGPAAPLGATRRASPAPAPPAGLVLAHEGCSPTGTRDCAPPSALRAEPPPLPRLRRGSCWRTRGARWGYRATARPPSALRAEPPPLPRLRRGSCWRTRGARWGYRATARPPSALRAEPPPLPRLRRVCPRGRVERRRFPKSFEAGSTPAGDTSRERRHAS
jgi:hypothetical protein